MFFKFIPLMEIIKKYFPQLTPRQLQQFEQLLPLYRDWNQKINVISRKDIDNLYERHVLHSLVIAKLYTFLPGAEVLDLGTGGGFPGIPLAIFFPETKFTLIDGTRKKIRVVEEIKTALGLTNVDAKQIRAEELKQQFDFVVSRAVAQLNILITWSFRLLKKKQQHATPNGLIALKGGKVHDEIKALPQKEYIEVDAISNFFDEAYFKEKYVVYVQG